MQETQEQFRANEKPDWVLIAVDKFLRHVMRLASVLKAMTIAPPDQRCRNQD